MFSFNKSSIFIFFIFNLLMLATTSSFAQISYTHELPYDHVPLNSKTWQEVDMSYWTTINGKLYLNTINLLRPQAYLNKYHMDQVGRKITLTLPEIGLNNNIVTITAIKPVPAFKKGHKNTCSQVIGLFKHYANHVKTYRFKDLTTGKISVVHATPNHPFYIKNKHRFLPISEVDSNDQLVGKNNHIIKLLCNLHQTTHCGLAYQKINKPTIVYNLEVYQQHRYRVSNQQILVHNAPCDTVIKKIEERLGSDNLWEHDRTEVYDNYNSVYVASKDTRSYAPDEILKDLEQDDTHSFFSNTYNSKQWMLEYNFKNSHSNYFMSDVIYKQAEIAFPEGIEKPELIMRKAMVNPTTRSMLKGLSGKLTEEQTKLFMTQTPNGKSTQRILDLFGWKVREVTLEMSYGATKSAFIYLQ